MALSKGKAKLVDRLRNPRLRPREGLFLVEGVRGVAELLRAPAAPPVSFALFSPRLGESEAGGELRARLMGAPFPSLEVSDGEMEALSDTEHSQGVLLVAAEPREGLSSLEGRRRLRLLLLDGVQDPGNAGTLIRAAWAFGVNGVLALEGTVDPWSPKTVRAAAGAIAYLPVVRTPWADAEVWLKRKGVPLLVADPAGEDLRTVRFPGPWALVVGNEGAGPRPQLKAAAARALAIPMEPGVDSLNAGVAGAILLFTLCAGSRDAPEDA